jgi:hypothetical protein
MDEAEAAGQPHQEAEKAHAPDADELQPLAKLKSEANELLVHLRTELYEAAVADATYVAPDTPPATQP